MTLQACLAAYVQRYVSFRDGSPNHLSLPDILDCTVQAVLLFELYYNKVLRLDSSGLKTTDE